MLKLIKRWVYDSFFPLIFTDSSEWTYLMGEPNKEISSGWLILLCDSRSVVESDYQFELICFNFPFLSFPCIPKLIESNSPEHLPTRWLWARLLRSRFWTICSADLATRFQKVSWMWQVLLRQTWQYFLNVDKNKLLLWVLVSVCCDSSGLCVFCIFFFLHHIDVLFSVKIQKVSLRQMECIYVISFWWWSHFFSMEAS